MNCPLCGKNHLTRKEAKLSHRDGTGPGSEEFQHAAVYGGRLYKRLGADVQSYNVRLQEHNKFIAYCNSLP